MVENKVKVFQKLKNKEKNLSELVAIDDERIDAKNKKKGERGRAALNSIATVYGLGSEYKSKLPGMKYHDQVIKAGASGAKALGDEFEAAHAAVEYAKGKKVQDLVHDAPGVHKLVMAQNTLAAAEVMKEAAKEFKSSIDMMGKNAERMIRNLADYLNSNPKMSDDEKGRQMFSTLSNINANGGQMDMSTLKGLVLKAQSSPQDVKVDIEQDLKVKVDHKAITDAINKAMAKGALTPEALRKELQDVFKNLGNDGQVALMQIIEKAVEKVMGQLK